MDGLESAPLAEFLADGITKREIAELGPEPKSIAFHSHLTPTVSCWLRCRTCSTTRVRTPRLPPSRAATSSCVRKPSFALDRPDPPNLCRRGTADARRPSIGAADCPRGQGATAVRGSALGAVDGSARCWKPSRWQETTWQRWPARSATGRQHTRISGSPAAYNREEIRWIKDTRAYAGGLAMGRSHRA